MRFCLWLLGFQVEMQMASPFDLITKDQGANSAGTREPVAFKGLSGREEDVTNTCQGSRTSP
jgi:hypothetical protein